MLNFTTLEWISYGISSLFVFFINLYIFLYVRRKYYALPYLLISLTFLVSFLFSRWSVLSGVSLATLIIFVNLFVVLNATELKAKIDVMFQFGKVNDSYKIINFDKELIYELIYDAVAFLSKNKTGALITLERTTKLDDYTKNGVMINAPISAELLTTIFYPGTRLHDGAVIVRGSFILAASVYYQPTTKPVLGKIGSRHRAAIGISETSDAVTIVVSEETGRISITYGGQLETVYLDSFKQTLANYMENRAHFGN